MISERIISAIRDSCKDDKVMGDFLLELISKESDYSLWQWRDAYRKTINEYLKKCGAENED